MPLQNVAIFEGEQLTPEPLCAEMAAPAQYKKFHCVVESVLVVTPFAAIRPILDELQVGYILDGRKQVQVWRGQATGIA